MLVYSLFIYFDMKMPFQNNTAQTCRYPRLFFVSGHGTTVPARDNSPSFQEGVPEGRGSNIGIRIPCDNWQRPPAAAGAPTPASGHPFPKEGEFRPHRHSHADVGKAALTRVPALLLHKI